MREEFLYKLANDLLGTDIPEEYMNARDLRRRRLEETLRMNNSAGFYSVAQFSTKVKAIASKNEFQQPLELKLIPLDVANGNKQLVPFSERDNILATAIHMPLRALFDGDDLYGYTNASDVGVITDVSESDRVIYGTAVIWKERNQELVDYIRAKGTVYTSFEIYYAHSEYQGDIEVLRNTAVAAFTLVKNPAYVTKTPAHLKD